MSMLVFQSFLLIAAAYLIGCALGCLMRGWNLQSEASRDAAAAAAAKVPSLPTASPYQWSATRTAREVVLSGSVPTELARAELVGAARRHFSGLEVVDRLSLAHGAPVGMAGAAMFGLQQLSRLTSGEATLTDQVLLVTGVAPSHAAKAALLANTPPAGYIQQGAMISVAHTATDADAAQSGGPDHGAAATPDANAAAEAANGTSEAAEAAGVDAMADAGSETGTEAPAEPEGTAGPSASDAPDEAPAAAEAAGGDAMAGAGSETGTEAPAEPEGTAASSTSDAPDEAPAAAEAAGGDAVAAAGSETGTEAPAEPVVDGPVATAFAGAGSMGVALGAEAALASDATPVVEETAAAAIVAETTPVDAPPIPEAQAAQAAAADAVGSRPAGLVAARGGKADNLKRIKGIGPQNEARLNALGTWHFDQIAAWSPTNAKWVGAFLAFPGRIEREDWITQAKALAAGEETAFSKRVDTGSVAYQAIDRAAEAKIVADIAEDGVSGDKPKDLP